MLQFADPQRLANWGELRLNVLHPMTLTSPRARLEYVFVTGKSAFGLELIEMGGWRIGRHQTTPKLLLPKVNGKHQRTTGTSERT